MSISGKNIQPGTSKAFLPSSYKMKSIELRNHRGETKDIQNICTKLVLTESLFSPTVLMKLSIKDSNNLLEEFQLIGQETCRIRIAYQLQDSGIERELDLDFFITEYPNYGRVDQHTQAYTLRGVSPQTYISNLKKISRAFSNNTALEIQNIFTRELGCPVDKFKIIGEPISTVTGIINTQTPIQACEWLRRQTVDDNYTPFFLYQNLSGTYSLASLKQLVDENANPVYQTYFATTNFKSDPMSEEDYLERATRILEVSSELKMSKLNQAKGGAYASQNRYLDISQKSFTNTQYNYVTDFDKQVSLERKNSLSSVFTAFSDTIDQYPDAHLEHIAINQDAFDGTVLNYNQASVKTKHYLNAYNSLLESYQHDVKLMGDFGLNPGRKISLQFPKAVDPSVYKDYANKSNIYLYDESISGNYLITSAIHTFEDDEYYVNCRVKRDGLSLDIEEQKERRSRGSR